MLASSSSTAGLEKWFCIADQILQGLDLFTQVSVPSLLNGRGAAVFTRLHRLFGPQAPRRFQANGFGRLALS